MAICIGRVFNVQGQLWLREYHSSSSDIIKVGLRKEHKYSFLMDLWKNHHGAAFRPAVWLRGGGVELLWSRGVALSFGGLSLIPAEGKRRDVGAWFAPAEPEGPEAMGRAGAPACHMHLPRLYLNGTFLTHPSQRPRLSAKVHVGEQYLQPLLAEHRSCGDLCAESSNSSSDFMYSLPMAFTFIFYWFLFFQGKGEGDCSKYLWILSYQS